VGVVVGATTAAEAYDGVVVGAMLVGKAGVVEFMLADDGNVEDVV